MTQIVHLNVGGCLFQTSKETLENTNTYFRALVEHSDLDDVLFIDRDPCLFRYILNWLRGVHLLPDDKSSLQELLYEADFYCIEEMKTEIKTKIQTATTYLGEMTRFGNELKYQYR